MLIPPQMIKQEINREVAREINIWRSQLVRAFNQLYRDTLNAKTEYEKAPSPTARDKLFAAIGQLQGYLEIRISLKQVYGDNTASEEGPIPPEPGGRPGLDDRSTAGQGSECAAEVPAA